jgi:hypothetical protein
VECRLCRRLTSQVKTYQDAVRPASSGKDVTEVHDYHDQAMTIIDV